MRKPPPQSFHHIPVLLDDVIRLLAPKKGESYLDLTAGYGGHAREILARTNSPEQATLVDRDPMAIEALEPLAAQGARTIHQDFARAAAELVEAGELYDMVLIDLGVSSPQLDISERGFSFQPGPLDMRMDQVQARSAASILNRSSERELIDILMRYGEERPSRARAIARAIRDARPLETTDQLADVVLSTHHGKWQKIHPATRTFQAIRIAVNDELGQIEQTLPHITHLLRPGGRVAIISFHSLEDRLVKNYFNEQDRSGYEAELRLLTKKAIRGSDSDVHNPRARSAILRAAAKLKTTKK
ncbi:16S rRNA (cytosine(1402)-N(4))-methyltransferase RsmH [Candidatus Saccharibacteria bacterium]|nr:MAG: 16S rRNA (cytosine(1402)-N(4))-methyltransferase RsmH [Candidatus Saccharibacteria bacterium]